MFDADRHHASVCPPWKFTRDGRTWVARHVSALAVERFLLAYNATPATPAGDQRSGRLIIALLRHAFPRRISYLWRPWEDPVQRIMSLDLETRKAALADFFEALGIQPNPQGLTGSTPSAGDMGDAAPAASET